MSTNLRPLSELTTPNPIDFSPLAARSAIRARSRFQDLGIVIERLFAFYEGMKTGKPVPNGDELLAQVGGALARSTRGRNQA